MVGSRRVAVTGVSTISPVAVGRRATWSAILAGKSGVGPITRFDTADFKSKIAAEVKNFNPEDFINPKDVKKMDHFIHYALAAAKEAVDQSGFQENFTEEMGARAGSIVGCGLGGLPEIENAKLRLEERGPKRILPFFIPQLISNLAPGHIGMIYGLRGPNFAITSACSSGAHAIGEAYRMIKSGVADVMVTGGTEGTISPLCIGGFNAMKALSTRNDAPEKASRPFDKDRDGFVCGEGSGILVLEDWERATKRNADILGEVVGYAANCDAYHMTAPAPEGRGAAEAMSLALKEAQINPTEIGSINAHGTSTGLGDIAETQAIKKAFGDHAKKIKICSTKSMTGHTLGAAGGIESVFSVLSLKDKVVPPTINLDEADPECDLDYVPNEAQPLDYNYCLSNSFGFGGTNACLIFRRA